MSPPTLQGQVNMHLCNTELLMLAPAAFQ